MSRKPGARPHGQIRRSQLITTFGPGAMLDLPNHSVLVGGLEYWTPGGDEITEARLVEKLARRLDVPALKLSAPPPKSDELEDIDLYGAEPEDPFLTAAARETDTKILPGPEEASAPSVDIPDDGLGVPDASADPFPGDPFAAPFGQAPRPQEPWSPDPSGPEGLP